MVNKTRYSELFQNACSTHGNISLILTCECTTTKCGNGSWLRWFAPLIHNIWWGEATLHNLYSRNMIIWRLSFRLIYLACQIVWITHESCMEIVFSDAFLTRRLCIQCTRCKIIGDIWEDIFARKLHQITVEKINLGSIGIISENLCRIKRLNYCTIDNN